MQALVSNPYLEKSSACLLTGLRYDAHNAFPCHTTILTILIAMVFFSLFALSQNDNASSSHVRRQLKAFLHAQFLAGVVFTMPEHTYATTVLLP